MKTKKGFTLIELMVVMAIIAVLSVLIIGAINIARQSARNSTRTSDVKTLQAALEAYYAGANPKAYPAQTTASTIYTTSGFRATMSSFLGTDKLTTDPNNDPNRVCYYAPASSSTYVLYVLPEPVNNGSVPACASTVPSTATDYSVK